MSIILFSPLKKNEEIKKISPVINRKLYGLALNFTVSQNLIAGNETGLYAGRALLIVPARN